MRRLVSVSVRVRVRVRVKLRVRVRVRVRVRGRGRDRGRGRVRLAAPSVAPSVLMGQGRHSVLVLSGLYVPIGQSTQRDPAASASPNVPSRQASQAVAASNDEK